MISDKLKKEFQKSIELNKIYYKNYNFNEVSLLTIFLGDIYKKIY